MTSAADVVRKKSTSILTIQELKAEGHFLIDRMVELGVSRDRVYEILAVQMHLGERRAHFGKMYTKNIVYRALSILERMIHEREVSMTMKDTKISARVAHKLVNQISLADQRRIFAERSRTSRLPWYKKMLYNITSKHDS